MARLPCRSDDVRLTERVQFLATRGERFQLEAAASSQARTVSSFVRLAVKRALADADRQAGRQN